MPVRMVVRVEDRELLSSEVVLTELIKAVGLSRRLLRRGCVSGSGGLVANLIFDVRTVSV